MATDLQLGRIYNFRTAAPQLLGAEYKAVKLLALLTLAEAMRYRDVVGLHESLLPSLPDNTPTNPDALTYIVFRPVDAPDTETITGSTVLALEWLVSDSIELVSSVDFELTVRNVSSTDINLVLETLREKGIRSVTTKTITK